MGTVVLGFGAALVVGTGALFAYCWCQERALRKWADESDWKAPFVPLEDSAVWAEFVRGES